ncbi:MAG TPA: RnfH family protein [Eoetvoesiella sp.]|uniref:RnfH family protein n=1 Tax=Eoetvoesiella sp. TaxID=1966355 RepID=UPI002BDA2CDB|nr:RnfH family protein [Eoetvoesiella sp.]HWK62981.1 RnfH family protein [Eoetvoesiella sp.]
MASSTAAGPAAMTVQVVYARPGAVWHKTLALPPGATLGQALEASGFAEAFPDAAAGRPAAGIYGQACSEERVLADGDRIEIYRPLVFDPMESRRRRALHRQAFMIKARNRPRKRKAKLAAAARSGV